MLNGTDVDLDLATPTDFEISTTSGSSFGSSITLTSYNGSATDIYVRLKSGLAVGTYMDDIDITGGGATAISVSVEGEVTASSAAPAAITAAGYEEDFSGFDGSGFSPNPSMGQLHSDNWRVTGLDDGSMAFGDTHTSGDFARGASAGGVGTGGVYGFEVASGDEALGVQPGGAILRPENLR